METKSPLKPQHKFFVPENCIFDSAEECFKLYPDYPVEMVVRYGTFERVMKQLELYYEISFELHKELQALKDIQGKE